MIGLCTSTVMASLLSVNDHIIEYYFNLRYTNNEILLCLAWLHSIYISDRTLKRRLRENGLSRRKNVSSIIDVALFIDNEMQCSGRLHGYRWMHSKCRLHGLRVSRESVGYILRELDPAGVATRRRRRLQRRQYFTAGPNEVWHIDGYDKLSSYGICIHGAIDGFSRKIIWLEAQRTNHDPAVIAAYYYNAVKSLNGCPKKIRADCGTENVLIEQMQVFLRDDVTAFQYGRSVNNQRIEAWWSLLRKENSQFWMDLFGHLKDETFFVGNMVDKALIQFFFLDIIQVRSRRWPSALSS